MINYFTDKQAFIKACNCGDTIPCMNCGKPVDTDTARNPFFCHIGCELQFKIRTCEGNNAINKEHLLDAMSITNRCTKRGGNDE